MGKTVQEAVKMMRITCDQGQNPVGHRYAMTSNAIDEDHQTELCLIIWSLILLI